MNAGLSTEAATIIVRDKIIKAAHYAKYARELEANFLISSASRLQRVSFARDYYDSGSILMELLPIDLDLMDLMISRGRRRAGRTSLG